MAASPNIQPHPLLPCHSTTHLPCLALPCRNTTQPPPLPPCPLLFHCSDASPIMVEVRESRPGLLRLLVRVCAVVGGAFAVTGIWDKIVHRAVTAAKQHLR